MRQPITFRNKINAIKKTLGIAPNTKVSECFRKRMIKKAQQKSHKLQA